MNTAVRMRLLVISMLALLAVALFGNSNVAIAATTGSVTGVVTQVDGSGLKGATVTLTLIAGSGSSATALTSTTTASGNYAFDGIAPGNYTVGVAAKGFDPETSPVVVQQDFDSSVDFTMQPHKIGNATRIIPNSVRRTDPTTAYVISAKTEQETKSQPNNLYQFPGLIFGQPGVTPDPSGYVHIRGSDLNQVGFEMDGVEVTEPLTNEFATNIVTVGLKSANLYTGGADASYGNATGGFINEVTASGKDFSLGDKLSGGVIEGTFGPSHGWNYSGTNDQFGGETSNGKFDYYLSTIMFKNDFPGNTNTSSLWSSFDGLAKFDLYPDKDDTFTFMDSGGFEGYNDYLVPNGGQSQDLKFNATPGPGGFATAQNYGTFQQPESDQGYNFGYFTYKHDFSSSSYLSYRLYRIYNSITFNLVSLEGLYEEWHTDSIGNQLDYNNIISTTNTFSAGLMYMPSTTQFSEVAGATAAISPSNPFYIEDLTSQIKPAETALYASDQIKTPDQKVALSIGGRYASQYNDLNVANAGALEASGGATAGNYTEHYLDPRLGLTVSPTSSFKVFGSASTDSQFPDTLLIERLTPEEAGIPPTAYTGQSAGQQALLESRYAAFNKLEPEHANDYDLGIEKGFNIANTLAAGTYDFTLTTYQRKQYDLIQYTRSVSYDPGLGFRGYDNAGHGHATGVESELTKRPVKQSDWNGFVSYTNQIAKATSSFFDTGYEPYYYLDDFDDPNLSNAQFTALTNTEVEPSYNQRHTIGVVIDKRISKLIETAAFLDSGSGFPFSGAATDAATLAGDDSQHGSAEVGEAQFSEVPVLLPDGNIMPISTTIGHSGWHYKITINTSFYLTQSTSLFLNVDNVFDKQTVLTYATSTQAGAPYYAAPSAKYPQGYEYFGPSTIITPIFVSFGFRYKF